MNISEYINENLPKCICYSPESSGTLIGLPYPYIVPCVCSPPFLSMMIRDYYEAVRDKKRLESAYEDLKLEYEFWKNKPMSDSGLKHYDWIELPKEKIASAAKNFEERTGLCIDGREPWI